MTKPFRWCDYVNSLLELEDLDSIIIKGSG